MLDDASLGSSFALDVDAEGAKARLLLLQLPVMLLGQLGRGLILQAGQLIQGDHHLSFFLDELSYAFFEYGQVRLHGVQTEQILRERLHLLIQLVNVDTVILSSVGHARLRALLGIVPWAQMLQRVPLTAILYSFDHFTKFFSKI